LFRFSAVVRLVWCCASALLADCWAVFKITSIASPAWDDGDRRKRQVPWRTIEEARQELETQARGLCGTADAAQVRAFVLDCSLRWVAARPQAAPVHRRKASSRVPPPATPRLPRPAPTHLNLGLQPGYALRLAASASSDDQQGAKSGRAGIRAA
jgi:hypothetical protein